MMNFRSQEATPKAVDTISINPVGIRNDTGTAVNQSATKPQTAERATNKHTFNPGSMIHDFFRGGEGSSAIMTAGSVAMGTVIGAMTGLMTMGYPIAAVIGGVAGAAFGWYAARHPNGD